MQPVRIPEISNRSIDRNTYDLKTQSRALKSGRNQRNYIKQLPDEVLSIIFLFSRDDSLQSSGATWNLDWLTVSAVCWRWRQICLSTPSLWSYIDLANLECAQAMMERSKAVPLSLRILLACDPGDARRWELACEVLSRTSLRVIDIQSPDREEILELLERRQCRSIPLLKSLKLVFLIRGDGNDEEDEDEHLRRDWPWYDMPSLRRLELDGVPLPTNFHQFPSLRVLKINPCKLISVDETLDILRDIPCIEELSVGSLHSGPSQLSQQCIETVNLPSLKRLEIRGDDALSARILQYFIFPPSASVHLKFDSSPLFPPTIDSFLQIVKVWSRIARNLSAGSTTDASDLSTHLSVNDTNRTLGIVVFQDPEASGTATHQPILELEYPLRMEIPVHSLIRTISSQVTALTLVNLKNSDIWVDLLHQFHNIHTLKLINCDLSILDTLRPPPLPRHTLVLPKLTTLILSNYAMENDANPAFHTSPSGDLVLLLALCIERVIEHVKVVDTTMTAGVFNHFRYNGVRVEWLRTKVVWTDGSDASSDWEDDIRGECAEEERDSDDDYHNDEYEYESY
ncbi:hypothetical protein ONZ45_g11275 [Pleurotus djamor]|nr:hypothetical protein ONZ45_g11275 [Pleurotus djamor]